MGWLGAKADRFIARRLDDPVMREQVFDEARQAFEFRDDGHRVRRREGAIHIPVRNAGGGLTDCASCAKTSSFLDKCVAMMHNVDVI